ncbi:hypothetical protein OH76DRAFT_1397538 [Lentinus brumalis]|uniref:Uncharacterized protein n=1 Tax=Lentinus brumalis TaxID=2498619 RepID=A0A371DRI5_9APHY|nr:hypothetical protein OH76DRAFT_1397538 [Polyporus brumalis]
MSFVPGSSRQPGPRQLQGSRPGLLDPTQPSRVLRYPNSTLSFAAFDPLAASGNAQPRKYAPDADPARPKRIVIETTPGNRVPSKWRFVPRARRAPGTPGLGDEGVWPRLVMINGEPFILSEDQWDIYKLDPAYDCFIPAAPHHPIITRKDPSLEGPSHRVSSTNDYPKKRRLSSPAPDAEEHRHLNKKFRTVVSLVTDDEGTDVEEASESGDEDEVEEIVIEESPRRDPRNSNRAKQRRKAREEQTRERREKVKAKSGSTFKSNRSRTPEIVDLTMDDITPEPTTANGAPAAGPTKRKVFHGSESPEETSPRGHSYQSNKRARTLSPGAARADLDRKRAERERRRMAQLHERMNGLKEQREQQFWKELFAQTPLPTPPPSQHNGDGQHTAEQAPPSEEDAERQAAIEESRRKLAELEKDRPLWEQEAQKRAMRERMEEEARRLRKEEERLRAAEVAAEEQRQRQRAEAAAAEEQRRSQAEQTRVQQEREQRRRKERARWSYGPWTIGRAMERYKMLSEEFDATKFTADNPLDFERVPWPVLHAPVTLRLEDIEWSAVEAFFEAAKKHMRAQDYKTFVEKSHKRFHPDRWRARGILKSVADEDLRNCLEVAANTVAQALTPIWRAMKG